MKKTVFTNCFLVKTDKKGNPLQVCLAMKKRGFGKGMWNGAGGKPDDGETVEEAAIREVREEFHILVKKLEKRGEIQFVLLEEDKNIEMHTFLTTRWEGEPEETEEMRPEWFPVDTVPYREMWEGDREWLPLILSGKKIRAKYTYAREGGMVQKRDINEVEEFG